MINRIENLRKIIDNILQNNQNSDIKRSSLIHLYGVSTFCIMIAIKRNLNQEIACAIGMLHDISSYIKNDFSNHAEFSKIEAEKILKNCDLFDKQEVAIIRQAIGYHSDKNIIHDEYDELIKDADVLQHYLYNTSLPVPENEIARLANLRKEFCF